MDGIKLAGRIGFQIGWAITELAAALYDLVSRRDPDAALHQYLAEHPGVTVFTVTDQPL